MIAEIQIGPPPLRRPRTIGDEAVQFLCGDVLEKLAGLQNKLVHSCITSPPYWGLRDYKIPPTDWQEVSYAPMPGLTPLVVPPMSCCLGNEPTPEAYVGHLVLIFREVRRVLPNDGTLWLNLGDTYAHNGPCGGSSPDGPRKPRQTDADKQRKMDYSVPPGLKAKDLIGVPWRIAFAMQADGWYLRSDIIWHKPNPMPESCRDRCTRSHEYVLMFSRSKDYFYDNEAIKEPCVPAAAQRQLRRVMRNKRDVWTIATHPFKGAHFSTFPEKLVEPIILASTSQAGCCPQCGAPWKRLTEKKFIPQGKNPAGRIKGLDASNHWNGFPRGTTSAKTLGWQPTCSCDAQEPVPCVVLDCFGGSGTTGLVAVRHGRKAILIDLNQEYIDIARQRVTDELRPRKHRRGSVTCAAKNSDANSAKLEETPQDITYECGPPPARRSQVVQDWPESLPNPERESETLQPTTTPEKTTTRRGVTAPSGNQVLISGNCLNGIYEALRFGAPDLCQHVEICLRRRPVAAGITPRQGDSVSHQHAVEVRLDDAAAILDSLICIERDHGSNTKFYDRQINFLTYVWRQRVEQLRRSRDTAAIPHGNASGERDHE